MRKSGIGSQALRVVNKFFPRVKRVTDATEKSMSEWLPIRTAPRDGTWILLWWPAWHHAPQAGYYANGMFGHGFGWRSPVAMSENSMPPTHWMPLPKPPDMSLGRNPNGVVSMEDLTGSPLRSRK